MVRRRPSLSEYKHLWGVLAFQFDPRVAEELLTPPSSIEVILGGSGRIRYVVKEGELLLTLRASDGMYSITLRAAGDILRVTKKPRFRIVVKGDRELRGSVLGRDVIEADPMLRLVDEVIVVDGRDRLIAVGRARVSGWMMPLGLYGEVARVRRKR